MKPEISAVFWELSANSCQQSGYCNNPISPIACFVDRRAQKQTTIRDITKCCVRGRLKRAAYFGTK